MPLFSALFASACLQVADTAAVVAVPCWVRDVEFQPSYGLELARLGDLDGDGVAEIALASPVQHDWLCDDWPAGSIAVLSGVDGHEVARLAEPHERLPRGCDQITWATSLRNVGDLDGDGLDDLVAEEWYCGDELCPHKREIMLRSASLEPRSIIERDGPSTNDVIGVDDIDGDGCADLLATQSSASSFLRAISGRTGETIYRSERAREFIYRSGRAPWAMESCAAYVRLHAFDDLDGDSIADVLVTGDPDGDLTIVSAASGATLRRLGSVRPRAGERARIARSFDDVDGDGERDLLVHGIQSDTWGGSLVVCALDGRWERELARGCDYGPGLRILIVPDLDGDAVDDLVVSPSLREDRRTPILSGRTGVRIGSIEPPERQDGVTTYFGSAVCRLEGRSGAPTVEIALEIERWRLDEHGELLPIVGWSVAKYALRQAGPR